MKKVFFTLLAFIALTTTSCTKDYTNPENLVGTTWRCDSLDDVDYFDLRFISITDVEMLVTYFGSDRPSSEGVYTYSVLDDSISITDEGEEFLSGTIDGKTMVLYSDDDISFTFEKQ